MSDAPTTRPPYSPAVAAALEAMDPDGRAASFPVEAVPMIRTTLPPEDLSAFAVDRRDLTVPGYEGAEITVSVFSPPGVEAGAPAVFAIHGGGMIFGDQLSGMSTVLPWVLEHRAVAVSVDYRLAPEHRDPYPVEDCYAALTWTAQHAADLGIDPDRIVVMGGSAGGGLAAGTALLARERGGPALLGQLLLYPMLDDRDATVSTRQYDGIGVWDRGNNLTGWTAYLGDRRGGDDVSIFAAPSRATDLTGLPPTFIDVGSAEVFRDECVAYASQLWADGCDAELHVWPGGTHGWEVLDPGNAMTRLAAETRSAWLGRRFEA